MSCRCEIELSVKKIKKSACILENIMLLSISIVDAGVVQW